VQLKPLFIALSLSLSPVAHAANLSDVFRDAQAYDAQYAAARAAYEAGQEIAVQGRAGLLPNVNLGGNVIYNSISGQLIENNDFESSQLAINATQPLFRKQNWVQYQQSKEQTKVAGIQLKSAEQDLILRVAQAYFDVLQSQDNIAFINAQKAAITEQLASAKRNFEVGTATIIDTNEAQARYDLAVAQEIGEQNTLNIRLRALEKITGKPAGSLDTLVEAPKLIGEPGSIDEWATRAADANLQAEIQRIAKTIADQEVERNRAGHYPTLDAVASYSINNNQPYGTIPIDTRAGTVGLQLNLPIYQGGLTSSQVRQAVANQEKARQEVEAAAREASQQARQAWLNVNSGVAQVKALEQALTSVKAQLDSTKLGQEVGVRTILDVLNAEQQVLAARRDLASARYNYLLASLSLKAAVGSLSPADLAGIDQNLRPTVAAK
jgi:outer membrane protein